MLSGIAADEDCEAKTLRNFLSLAISFHVMVLSRGTYICFALCTIEKCIFKWPIMIRPNNILQGHRRALTISVEVVCTCIRNQVSRTCKMCNPSAIVQDQKKFIKRQ